MSAAIKALILTVILVIVLQLLMTKAFYLSGMPSEMLASLSFTDHLKLIVPFALAFGIIIYNLSQEEIGQALFLGLAAFVGAGYLSQWLLADTGVFNLALYENQSFFAKGVYFLINYFQVVGTANIIVTIIGGAVAYLASEYLFD